MSTAVQASHLADDPLQLLRTSGISVLDLFDNIPWFKSGADWTAWRAFLCALYALPMTDQEFDIYRECTGRKDPPTQPAEEAYVPTGRRARKSAVGSLIAVERSLIPDYTRCVAPGQSPLIPVLADKRENAATIMSFVKGILDSAQALRECVKGEPAADTVRLTSGVDIRVRAASLSAGRSPAIPLAILDECAFFPTDDSAQPDTEIVAGIKPAMATFPNRLLLCLSSPYAKRGVLWTATRDHWGVDGRVLVWKAPTLRMHDTPTVRVFVEEERKKDPVAASAEYDAEFRSDISSPFDDMVLLECTDKGVSEHPPVPGVTYIAFVDPSGGSSDSFTLSIAHWDGAYTVQDYVGEWPAPYQPAVVVREATAVLKRYGLKVVEGDHYGGEWPAERFTDGLHDDTCLRSRREAAPCSCEPWKVAYGLSERTKGQLYLDLLPIVNDRRTRLLDNARQRIQFAALERRTSRGGRDAIDHPPNGHDDVANAVAGAVVKAAGLRIAPRTVKPEATTTSELFRDRLNEVIAQRRAAGARRSNGGGGGSEGVGM
jgi:hypothetical protein